MRRFLVLGLLVAGFGLGSGIANAADGAGQGVRVVADEAHQRVDITIDGKAFTSYIWPTSLKKPVLYPLITDEGITVTRGYPLEPRPGERVDHPHHAGMWFNYGNVNGFDFWNNSDAIKPEDREKMGSIRQDKILPVSADREHAEIVTETTWVDGKGEGLLRDHSRLVFRRTGSANIIDRETTL